MVDEVNFLDVGKPGEESDEGWEDMGWSEPKGRERRDFDELLGSVEYKERKVNSRCME